jgi:transposase
MASKRGQYTAAFKAKVVLQLLSGEKTSGELCRSHKLNSATLNRWRKEFLDQAASIFEQNNTHRVEHQRIEQLERLVGQLSLELEIAKKASNLLSPDRNGRW